MQIKSLRICQGVLSFAFLLLTCGQIFAGVTASISGTVKDPAGAAVVGAKVTATNTETGVVSSQLTNGDGYYSFQSLPLGRYDIDVQQTGFKAYRQTGLVLDVNAALVVDIALQIGQISEKVEVSSGALHVETASSQLGEVIEGQRMTTVPLVSRSYTDLLALQPGVVATPSGISGGYAGQFSAFTSAGFAEPAVSGSLNGGALSVNGQREANNGFILNGINVKDSAFGGTTVIPNLDSLAEFRILTNNYDAEYGNYSGGQINVVTKSGTNSIHGNVFEFLRNTSLDAKNFFDGLTPGGTRGVYHQNEFGGTVGGPIKKDKIFFFADYQGNRIVQGVSTGIAVPSSAELGGDFSAPGPQQQLALANKTIPVTATAWANQLSTELGYPVTPGEPYFFAGCTDKLKCVFPNAMIPAAIISPIAQNLLKFFPAPTQTSSTGAAFFSSSAFGQRLTDNKTSGRVDANTRFGTLFSYYVFDRYSLNNPYPTANVPGFSATGTGQTQAIALGDTKTFGSSNVNEFRLGFVRVNNIFNQPNGGKGVTLASLGFPTGGNGIIPLAPAIEGVPEVDFLGSGTVIGVPSRPIRLLENTYQVVDNFSKISGTHTLRFGGSFHYNQLVEQIDNVLNGNFQFDGSETGIDYADFLIGAPVVYVQGQALPFNGRSKYFGLYGQDSWRARSNLTLNYGLRWDVSPPWYEQHNQYETIVPGLQSKVFPGSPTGWVFPGDPGISRGLAPTRYNNFGPRLGLAYSPSSSDGLLRKLTGGPGQTSIRAGYGVFFTALEGSTNYNEIGDSPFGFFYTASAPQFATPFADRTDNGVPGQKFPVVFPSLNVGPKNPDNSVNWTNFTPIGSSPAFYYKNRLPYAENYDLSLQRQFGTATLLTLSYVGAQGHRLLTTMEANPGNPQACLAIPGCGPGTENNFDNVRSPFPNHNLFQSDAWFITNGQSSYNSLQLSLRHTTGRLQLLAGYTWSKSLDNSSGYGEQVNFLGPKRSIALSAFDATHNFVASYNYSLPLDKLASNRMTQGWALSGITRFSTGLPVIIYEGDNNSLLGTTSSGPIPLGLDEPNYVGGPVHLLDPRSGSSLQYFDASGFSQEVVGQLGNSSRRFFHGPGINNWDMALLKDTKLAEKINLQFRAEFFNVFNHTQFGFVQGNKNAGNFGSVTSAAPPRIGQLSLKLNF